MKVILGSITFPAGFELSPGDRLHIVAPTTLHPLYGPMLMERIEQPTNLAQLVTLIEADEQGNVTDRQLQVAWSSSYFPLGVQVADLAPEVKARFLSTSGLTEARIAKNHTLKEKEAWIKEFMNSLGD